MRKQFKDTVMDLATTDGSIVILLGDVSVYLFNEFKERHPHRFYNMGICENTLISMAGGMAAQGLTPFVHTIAPFLTERSYEQIKLDLCYNRFPANILTCGATFDYAWDGPSHHCYTDLAILRLLPGMEVLQPGSRKELDVLLRSHYNNGNPTYFRLSDFPHGVDIPVAPGKAVVLKDEGSTVTVMTAGPLLGEVFEACKDLAVNLVYHHTIKPLDAATVERFRDTHILSFHDAFGLKEALADIPELRVTGYGLRDEFCTCYGRVGDMRSMLGLDAASIRETVRRKLESA
ncbi:MAG: hypothetical protein HY795_16330 [Desulfovibrio sp.]|nr:hypothetical protein [Desulfovibrio sp.]MBI4959182.1 hypothetical protein [Desulfovibrio sp.]